MKKTLIYYRTGQIDLAKKLQDNYIAHQTETDIISAEEQDDIEYARETIMTRRYLLKIQKRLLFTK